MNYKAFRVNDRKNNINIIFDDGFGKKYNTIINEEDNIFSIFQKYINLTGKYNKNFDLLFNGRILNPMSKVRENNISSGSIIRILEHNNLVGRGGGGFCINFTDLSKQIYSECPITNTAPNYRTISQGIIICGNCKSEQCYAYNQEVCVPLNGINRFDLIKERENLKCPACRGLMEPKTVAFYLCGYKIRGKNFVNGQVKDYEFYGNAKNSDSVQYYDPTSNGNTLVIELIIELTNYF